MDIKMQMNRLHDNQSLHENFLNYVQKLATSAVDHGFRDLTKSAS